MPEKAAKIPPPPFAATPEARATLGAWLSQLAQDGQSAKGGLPNIWQEVERSFRDEMPDAEETEGEGESIVHIGILSPRVETLATDTNAIVLNQDPYMLCQYPADPEISERLEKLCHVQWEQGGFDKVTRLGTIHAGLTNNFIYRPSFYVNADSVLDEYADQITLRPKGFVRYAGIKLDGIQAYDFVIGPSTVDGIQSAAIVGHRFFQTVAQVKQKVHLDLYFPIDGMEIEDIGGDSPYSTDHAPAYYNAMVAPEAFSGHPEIDQVECYELFFRKIPEGEKLSKWYRAVIAAKSQMVFECAAWPYSRPPYFTAGFLVDLIGFWGGRSVGRKMIPVQSEYDRVHSRIYNGSMDTSQRAVYMEGPIPGPEEYIETPTGTIIPMSPGSKPPWTMPNDFNPEGLLQLSQGLERSADSIVQVSTNSLGQEDPGNITATQTASINQGASNRMEDYVANFTQSYPQMAAFTMELLYDNWPIWHAYYDDELLERDDLLVSCRWEPNGKTPASTPAARRAALGQIMAFAKDPNAMIDTYEVAKLALRYSGIPGAEKLQREKPVAIPQAIPGQPPQAPAAPGGPPLPPGPMAPPEAPGGGGIPDAQPLGGSEPSSDTSGPGPQGADLRAAA